jgi:hypothetical protein
MDRPTGELVVLLFTVVVSAILLLSAVGVFALALFIPATDTDTSVRTVGAIVNTIIGALIGYVAGRVPEPILTTNALPDHVPPLPRHAQPEEPV